MQVPSTSYASLLSQMPLKPIYLVSFEGVPTRFSTGTVQNALGVTKTYLRGVAGAGQQITPNLGLSSISSVNFSIMDKDGEITYLIFQYQMANRKATVKMGFQDLDESAYATVFVGKILTYTLEADNTFYKFQTTDLQRDTKQNIFTALTNVTVPVAPGDVTINVSDTSAFASATLGKFYFRINDEVIAYTGKTATSFTGCLRGQLGTVAAGASVTDTVLNFIVLQNNPLTIALQILTSTGLGTNGAYDVLPASCGLGIPQASVNVTKFESERDRWTSGIVFRFEEQDVVIGKDFLQQQIYAFCPAYPVVDNHGRLSIKVVAPPLPSSQSVQTPLNDSNIVERPSFVGNVLDNYFFNELDLSYDYNFLTKTFITRTIYTDPTSIQLFDIETVQTMQSRGMRLSVLPQHKIDNFGLKFLKRYSIPSPILQAKGFLNTRLIEVGDVLPLTNSKLPNLKTGTIGVVSQLMEVIQAAPDYISGSVMYQLLNTIYTYGKRYAAISPTVNPPVNFPVYTAATPAQRNYAFISNKVTATRGIMSNGDDGYYITT